MSIGFNDFLGFATDPFVHFIRELSLKQSVLGSVLGDGENSSLPEWNSEQQLTNKKVKLKTTSVGSAMIRTELSVGIEATATRWQSSSLEDVSFGLTPGQLHMKL